MFLLWLICRLLVWVGLAPNHFDGTGKRASKCYHPRYQVAWQHCCEFWLGEGSLAGFVGHVGKQWPLITGDSLPPCAGNCYIRPPLGGAIRGVIGLCEGPPPPPSTFPTIVRILLLIEFWNEFDSKFSGEMATLSIIHNVFILYLYYSSYFVEVFL